MERDTQKLWNLTKALNDDQQHSPRAALLKEGTQIFTGKKAAYLLADSFWEDSLLDISREKQTDIRMTTKEQLQKQSPTPSMTSEFSIHELNCAIRQLKNKETPGKDDISNEMIRHLRSVAKQKLLDIYNHSWNTGTFPTSWKEAIIIPILKKEKDRHSKTSYRPISLLSCLGKTMERMVNRCLQHHLEKNGLLSPSQSGFRKNRSTEDQVTLLTQAIENGFQQKMKTLAVFVDLTKAFDKVWKEGLLFKLLRKRVCGNIHVLMDPELLVSEISTSQAWWTDQLFSENQRSPTRWSHLTHSLHYFHWWHLWPAVLSHPAGAACRQSSIMDQSRASDHRSHQDAGSNESHLRLDKKVAGNDQQNQDWSHLLLPVSQERRVHPADQRTRNPPARHPNCEVRQKTDLVSPHQYHAQQRTQENGPDEETGRNKMGSQHENLDPGLHCTCQTPHGVCLQCLVICCRD